MSDAIQHECGIAFLRLKKPLDFYLKKYGSAFFGLKNFLFHTIVYAKALGGDILWKSILNDFLTKAVL